jgi:hypothetical protein
MLFEQHIVRNLSNLCNIRFSVLSNIQCCLRPCLFCVTIEFSVCMTIHNQRRTVLFCDANILLFWGANKGKYSSCKVR